MSFRLQDEDMEDDGEVARLLPSKSPSQSSSFDIETSRGRSKAKVAAGPVWVSYLKYALIAAALVAFFLGVKSVLSNPELIEVSMHACMHARMLQHDPVQPEHRRVLPTHASSGPQAFVEAARQHPGKVVPIFMLVNYIAPLLLLPSGPFLILAGALWGIGLGALISGTVRDETGHQRRKGAVGFRWNQGYEPASKSQVPTPNEGQSG